MDDSKGDGSDSKPAFAVTPINRRTEACHKLFRMVVYPVYGHCTAGNDENFALNSLNRPAST